MRTAAWSTISSPAMSPFTKMASARTCGRSGWSRAAKSGPKTRSKQRRHRRPRLAPRRPNPRAHRSNPLRTVNVVCLILNDLNPETRAFAFESARKFVNQELRPNTFIGVFSLDASGLRPVYPFSNNRERLLKAVELAAVNQLPAMSVGSATVLNGLTTRVGVTGLGSRGSGADPLGSQHDMTFAATEGLREIDALKGLVRQLSPLPFQKTVLLF